jgi:hypothetical protein
MVLYIHSILCFKYIATAIMTAYQRSWHQQQWPLPDFGRFTADDLRVAEKRDRHMSNLISSSTAAYIILSQRRYAMPQAPNAWRCTCRKRQWEQEVMQWRHRMDNVFKQILDDGAESDDLDDM